MDKKSRGPKKRSSILNSRIENEPLQYNRSSMDIMNGH